MAAINVKHVDSFVISTQSAGTLFSANASPGWPDTGNRVAMFIENPTPYMLKVALGTGASASKGVDLPPGGVLPGDILNPGRGGDDFDGFVSVYNPGPGTIDISGFVSYVGALT